MHSHLILSVPGLHCPTELQVIRVGLADVAGVSEVQGDYVARELHVEFDPQMTSLDAISRRLVQLGFPPNREGGDCAQSSGCHHPSISRWPSPILRLAAGLLTLAVAVAVLQGPPVAVALLSVGAVCFAGWQVTVAAWKALISGRLDMHVLVVLAVAGALLTSQWLEAAATMWLFAISIWLESWQLDRARRSVEQSFQAHEPPMAHRIVAHDRPRVVSGVAGNQSETTQTLTEDVPGAALQKGDRIVVRPGERIPTDGIVLRGQSSVDQSLVTGESLPIDKSPGDTLYGGTLNQDGILEISITNCERDSLVAQIAEVLRRSNSAPGATQRFMDQFARWYTPAVVLAAVTVAVLPPFLTQVGERLGPDLWTEWFRRGLVLLVISCPCALLISTPFTIFAGLHRTARRGIIVKGGQFLEAVGQLDAIAFDKTGTLTIGTPQLKRIVAATGWTNQQILGIAATLERDSDHPLAATLRNAASQTNTVESTAEGVQVLRGFGVRGQVNGQPYLLTSPRYLQEFPRSMPAQIDEAIHAESNCSVALLANQEMVVAAFFFEDQLRPEAIHSLARLRQLGIGKIALLTGDRQATAKQIHQQ
ncbi:MAG: cation-translocating P-type ATPase, partial [Planctomycetota bacterium]|nr:cation-translocating P-type ATPase [Planctomycetota bacterium]